MTSRSDPAAATGDSFDSGPDGQITHMHQPDTCDECTKVNVGPCPHVRSAATISQRDLDLVKTALDRTEHTRRCEGFYRCTCIVGKADEALKRIEEAVRAAS